MINNGNRFTGEKIQKGIAFLKCESPRDLLNYIIDKTFYFQRPEFRLILNQKLYNEKENIVNSHEINPLDLILLIKTLLILNNNFNSEYFIKTFNTILDGLRKKLDINVKIENMILIDFIFLIIQFKSALIHKNKESFINNIDYVLKGIIAFLRGKMNPTEEFLINIIEENSFSTLQTNSLKCEEQISETNILRKDLNGNPISSNNTSVFDTKKDINKKEETELSNKSKVIEKEEVSKSKNPAKMKEENNVEKASNGSSINISNLGSNCIVMINSQTTGNDNFNITKSQNLIQVNYQIKFDITKNFSKPYPDYFLQNKGLNKGRIYSKIDSLLKTYYEIETKLSKQYYNNLEMSNLLSTIKNIFTYYDVYSIGSSELNLITNHSTRTFTSDILINTKDSPLKEVEIYENFEKCSNNEFEFKQLSKNQSCTKSYDCLLKCIRNDQIFNIRVIHQDDKMLLTHKVLYRIFNEDKFKKLHVFIQEIFFDYFKIASTRFQISCLIVGFLIFKFPNSEKLSCITSKVIKKEGKLLGKKVTVKDETENYCFDFREEDIRSFKSPSELLFEFFDFLKRYLNYNKLAIQQEINPKNQISFKSIEEEYLKFLKQGLLEEENYLFNFKFLKERLKDKQKLNFYSPKGEQMSRLLFCMIENSEKLDEYKYVLSMTEQIIASNK